MTNIAIAIGILLIAAGCATAYGIKSRKTTKGRCGRERRG